MKLFCYLRTLRLITLCDKMKLLKRSSWYTRRGSIPRAAVEKERQGIDDLVVMAQTLDQETAIQKLREIAEGKLPHHLLTYYELQKWLIARNFNQEKAEEMLTKHLDWRRELDIDNLLSWNASEVVHKYYPVGFSGYDNDGVPVWIVPFGYCDIRGLLHSCPRREFLLYTFQVLEKAIHDVRIKNEGVENGAYRLSCIFDMEYFSLRHFSWKPALDLLLQLIQMYEANYPELLQSCYVINAPRIFSVAFAIVKPFLHQVTMDKIKIYGKTGWQEAILEEIPRDQLPVHYNGTQTDPDGDPKCSSKICYGGEVPKTYYLKKKKLTEGENKKSYKSLILGNGSKETFDLEVAIPGTELRWEFQSDDFDVGFGIARLLAKGGEDIILPLQRVNSQLVPEEGSMICSDPGTYQVTFDNVYSYIRSKSLYYKLELFPPSEHTKF